MPITEPITEPTGEVDVKEPMTPAELRCVLDYLGLSAQQGAKFAGVTRRTVFNWLSGFSPVSEEGREKLEALESYTADVVGALVAALSDAADVGVVVYETDAQLHAARPDLADHLSARWWRHVVMRATTEVPGVTIVYPGDEPA